ncbi:hypothetical protein C7N43_00790 [Sphingobacteriales bacterium UPWRP_1]|nr:hypothetical protein C7N43_00790 [Sphingobacteriales bacterium UPWRP_1]
MLVSTSLNERVHRRNERGRNCKLKGVLSRLYQKPLNLPPIQLFSAKLFVFFVVITGLNIFALK